MAGLFASYTVLLSPLLLLLLLPTLFTPLHASSPPHPHIILIMADDLGFSDLGFRDANMHTPNIDRMAKEGVKLTNSYVSYACTPSRASLLTSQYVFRMGLQTQTMVFGATKNNTLPLDVPVLPEYLKKLGYSTHYVGKWHLGFCRKKATPTGRGFDTFYGLYNGKAGYYNHFSKKGWYDFHMDVGDNYTLDRSAAGKYSTFLFTNRTVDILNNHNKTKPLFIFLGYQAVHGPLEVPKEYKKNCSFWKSNPNRKTVCAMTAAMDEGVGTVLQTLKDKGYENDVITIFMSDNGGPVNTRGQGYSNYPLRGGKKTIWEGGTKVPTIIHSKKYLPKAPYEWNSLMHAVDWVPTLLGATGGSSKITLGKVDGLNNWPSIANNSQGPREEFVYNIDLGKKNTSAIRWKQYKLINNKAGSPDGWHNPEGNGTYEKPPSRQYPEYMLYDVEKDPSERKDLLKEGSEGEQKAFNRTFAKMKKKLDKFKTQVKPPLVFKKVKKVPRKNNAWETGFCEPN
ncbi:hypothetical protein ACOMHN_059856 [Nucella lapillus]